MIAAVPMLFQMRYGSVVVGDGQPVSDSEHRRFEQLRFLGLQRKQRVDVGGQFRAAEYCDPPVWSHRSPGVEPSHVFDDDPTPRGLLRVLPHRSKRSPVLSHATHVLDLTDRRRQNDTRYCLY